MSGAVSGLPATQETSNISVNCKAPATRPGHTQSTDPSLKRKVPVDRDNFGHWTGEETRVAFRARTNSSFGGCGDFQEELSVALGKPGFPAATVSWAKDTRALNGTLEGQGARFRPDSSFTQILD
jgi:hypothetical protein